MVELLPLAEIDVQAVEDLLDAAFGADRFGRTAYRLRAVPQGRQAVVDTYCGTMSINFWPACTTLPGA